MLCVWLFLLSERSCCRPWSLVSQFTGVWNVFSFQVLVRLLCFKLGSGSLFHHNALRNEWQKRCGFSLSLWWNIVTGLFLSIVSPKRRNCLLLALGCAYHACQLIRSTVLHVCAFSLQMMGGVSGVKAEENKLRRLRHSAKTLYFLKHSGIVKWIVCISREMR
jgi:hypothetical protein